MKISMVVVPVLLASAGVASAQMPHMGGDMKHVMVHRMMDDVMVMVDTMVPTPELQNYGEMYMGNASVLNDTWYNAQYGWMKEGTWTPPTGAFVWIEQTSATPGLMAFKGGKMSNMDAHTFEPIFGTDGSSPRIMWDGTMLHNWYAVSAPGGTYEATYKVYFGDASGVALDGYGAGEATLTWVAVPTPGAALTLALGGLCASHRRRSYVS